AQGHTAGDRLRSGAHASPRPPGGDREAGSRARASAYPRRRTRIRGGADEPDSGAARALVARHHEPLPRAHRPRTTGRSHAGANVELVTAREPSASVRPYPRHSRPLGEMRLRDLTPNRVAEWSQRNERTLARTTALLALIALRQILRYAVRQGWIGVNPIDCAPRSASWASATSAGSSATPART